MLNVVMVGLKPTLPQDPIEAAFSLGLRPVVLVNNFSDRRKVTAPEVIPVGDFGVMNILRQVELLGKVDGIVACGTDAIVASALAREKLGLKGPSSKSVLIAINKIRTKSVARQLGIATISGSEVKFNAAFDSEVLDSFNFPIMVKPVDQDGNRGVSLASNIMQYKDAVESCKAVAESDSFIVEKFIEGVHLSVEQVTCSGKTTTYGIIEKTVAQGPYPIEMGGVLPAKGISECVRAKIENAACRIIKAIGLDWTQTHIEFILSENKLYLLEVNPRIAGGPVPRALSAAIGHNVWLDTWNLSMGAEVTAKKPVRLSVMKTLPSLRANLKTNLNEKDIFTDGNLTIISNDAPGTRPPVKTNADRQGFAIFTTSLTEEPTNALQKIERKTHE